MENEISNQRSLLVIPKEKWHQKITVEPTLFLYMMAFMLTSVVEQAFFLYKACRVNHNYTEEICTNLEVFPAEKKLIQVTVSNFHQWNGILGHIVPIILALFLGSWSDKRGRKLPLIIGLFGKFIYSAMVIVNTKQNWPLEYVIYTATIPSALTGADVAIFASAFAYISDVSSVEQRTLRVTILDVCYLSTMPTGVALGAYLYESVVKKSFTTMFIINASLLGLSIIYSIVHLKWQTTKQQKSIKGIGCFGLFADFFDKYHVIQSIKTLTKKRDMKRRLYLWIFMITMALYTFQRDEKPMMYLYTNLKFNWDAQLYSYYKTFQSTAYVVMMLIGIPVMSKIFGWKDTVIVMIGASAHATARLFFIFAEQPYVLYIGAAVSSLGPIVAPVLRSMTSKIVPISERGKVFAILSVFDNAVPMFSGVLYSQVYNATIYSYPVSIFWLTLSTQIAVLLLILVVHKSLGAKELAVDENEKTLTNDEKIISLIKNVESNDNVETICKAITDNDLTTIPSK